VSVFSPMFWMAIMAITLSRDEQAFQK